MTITNRLSHVAAELRGEADQGDAAAQFELGGMY